MKHINLPPQATKIVTMFAFLTVIGVTGFAGWYIGIHSRNKVIPNASVSTSDTATDAKATEAEPQTETTKKTATTPKPTTTTTEKKTTSTSTTEKTEESKPDYVQVEVTLEKVGDAVVASIRSAKPGKCYFTFKDYSDDTPKYTDKTTTATDGECEAPIPDGRWTHAMVTYKSDDGEKKGWSDKIEI